MNISWKDAAHYGSAFVLLGAAGVTELGVHLPGISVDPAVAGAAGVGILAAGLKGGVTSGTKAVIAFLAIMLVLSLAPARAADLQDKAPAFTLPSVPSNPCTASGCTGLYGGAFFGGLGDNVNVLGNGINGSFNSGGMLPGVDVGWQYFDGKFYLGLEADVGYQFASSQALAGAVGSFNGPFSIVQAKVGASLSALAPSLVSSTSSLPLTIITPYLAGGEMMQQHGGTGGVGGGGILFQLGTDGANFLDVEYLNGGGAGSTGNSTATDNNIFRVGLDHLF